MCVCVLRSIQQQYSSGQGTQAAYILLTAVAIEMPFLCISTAEELADRIECRCAVAFVLLYFSSPAATQPLLCFL